MRKPQPRVLNNKRAKPLFTEKATLFSLQLFHQERATPSKGLAHIVSKEMNKIEVRLKLTHEANKSTGPFPMTWLHPIDPSSPTWPASPSTRYSAGFFHQIRSIPTRQHRHEQLQPINPLRDGTKLTHNASSKVPGPQTRRLLGWVLGADQGTGPGAKSGKHWDNNLTAAPPAQGRALHPLV